MRRIMLLDDEINVLNALQRTLRQCFKEIDLKLETFVDPEQALLRSAEVPFDVVMSDYRMPGMNGAEFLHVIMGVQPEASRLILSASTDFSEVTDAINRAEVLRYVAKPWQHDDLHKTFLFAFARHDDVVAARRMADDLRAVRGEMSSLEIETRRLEAEEPGITMAKWGADGSVHLE